MRASGWAVRWRQLGAVLACVIAFASLLAEAAGGWHIRPSLWTSPRLRINQVRCMALRGAGLHRKGAGDYYDDLEDENDDLDDLYPMGMSPLQGQQRRQITTEVLAGLTEKVDGSPKACFPIKKLNTQHLSPAARLFLAGQNENLDSDEEEDCEGGGRGEDADGQEESEDMGLNEDTNALDGVRKFDIRQHHDENLAGQAGSMKVQGRGQLPATLCDKDNEYGIRDDEYDCVFGQGLQHEIEAMMEEASTGATVSASESGLEAKSELRAAEIQAVEAKPLQGSPSTSCIAEPVTAPAVAELLAALVETGASESPGEDRTMQGRGEVEIQLSASSKDTARAESNQLPRAKSASPKRPSTHSLALKIQRWCKVNSCTEMKLRMIKVGLPHETIQFECVAKVAGQMYYGRSCSKRAAHHAALLQVEEAMRTGTLLPDSATVLLEHAQAGLNDIAQQEKDAVALKRLDDAAAFAASVAKLESTKHIPLEEQVSSPGPAASTRSRIAAAPAVAPAPPGSVMPSVSVIDPVDPSRSIPSSQPRAGQITPRVASPAPGIAAVADAGLGSDSGAASIRQNQNHVRVQMLVPRAKMGLLIGTQGKNIRELLQEAKTLHAHLHVPSITSSDDKATESGGDKPVMKKNGLVIITGPRESVAKLKDKVAAIISGQTPPESRDPLAYIEPYIQWQGAQSSGSSVPKEAQRLLQLIQKLSSPAAATEGNTGDQLPDNDSLYTEIAPRDAAKLAAAKSVSAIRNQSDLVWFPYPAHYDHEMQAPATPALAAAPHNRRASVTNEIGQVQHVTKGAFGSSPSKAGANTAPISAPDISALRFKLDHVAQGLETVTRALGQLSMNLPENLEPYPSEIAESFVLKKGSKIDEHSSCAPLVVHSWRCLQHQVEVGAQEHPGRLEVIFGASGVLMQEPLRNELLWEQWDHQAPLADILRVHEWAYVSDLQKQCAALQGGGIGSLDVDTNICADSYDAAAVAAGAACRAVDRVAAAPPGPRRVFVAVRPPGHHAGPWGRVSGPQGDASSSQGFCLLNSVAIAAAYARYTYRGLLDKIAIVDFDVHYGDGTAACVLNLLPGTHQTDVGHGLRISMPSYKPWLDDTDPDKVMFASVHLSHAGFYPDHKVGVEGSVPGMKNIVSVPLRHGTKSAEFRSVVTERLLSRVAEFKPDLILVSAGFDGHKDDFQGNGGGLQLIDEDYGWITQQLVDIANKHSQGRLISVLEGGYHVPADGARITRSGSANMKRSANGALASSVAAHVTALTHS